MQFVYPAIFTEENGSYIVEFPDLEGCQTFGATQEEALQYAEEALAGYLFVLLEEERLPVKASKIQNINPKKGFTTLVSCNVDEYKESRAVKKTLTIPSWLNNLATKAGVNFSQVLQEGLMAKLTK